MTSLDRLFSVDVREMRCPLWALAAPGLYLAACLLSVRSVLVGGAEPGISALLLAVGLVPAFAIPAIFTQRRARLCLTDGGLLIDGRAVKIDDARLERAERGSASLHFMLRDGQKRSFLVPSYKDAQRMVAMLPPVSAPVGALAA
jgi:hypothetical protein